MKDKHRLNKVSCDLKEKNIKGEKKKKLNQGPCLQLSFV